MAGIGDGTLTHPPTGHVLTDDTGAAVGGCGAVGMVLAGIVLLIAINSNSTLFTVLAVIVFVLGLMMALAGILEARRWKPLELHFPVWPLPLGSTSRVEVLRLANRRPPDADVPVDGTLTCKESATYTVGTDQRTDTETVYEASIGHVGELRSGRYRGSFDLHIPADHGAPTFGLGNNKVEWELKLDVNQLSRIMSTLSFTLVVATQLDAGLQNIQDAPAGAHE